MLWMLYIKQLNAYIQTHSTKSMHKKACKHHLMIKLHLLVACLKHFWLGLMYWIIGSNSLYCIHSGACGGVFRYISPNLNGSNSKKKLSYSLYSKWPPFSRTQACSRTRHCHTAQLIMSWLKWRHSSTRHCFKWSTSRILVRYTHIAAALAKPHSQVDWHLGNWVATSVVRWNPAFQDKKCTVSRARCTAGTLRMDVHVLETDVFKFNFLNFYYLRNYGVFFVETWKVCVK